MASFSRTPRDVASERIRLLRKRHGFTQQDLADRLNLFGARTDRTAVAKVELGQRGVSLNELVLYAMALDVAPVHLIAPTDDDELISLGPDMTVTPAEMRAWVRGERPLPWQDERIYCSEVPKKEYGARRGDVRSAPLNLVALPSVDALD